MNTTDDFALGVKQESKSLLTSVGEFNIPSTNIPFFAKNHFAVNFTANKKNNVSPVKISFAGERFEYWFMDKREPPFGGSVLACGELSFPATSSRIIAELGGYGKVETTLVELSYLMKAQWNGKAGSLLTNGNANMFYVRDVNYKLRAVDAHWLNDSWRVIANEIANLKSPCILEDGFRIFYRKY